MDYGITDANAESGIVDLPFCPLASLISKLLAYLSNGVALINWYHDTNCLGLLACELAPSVPVL